MRRRILAGDKPRQSFCKKIYAVDDANVFRLIQPGQIDDPLTHVLRDGAAKLLACAVEAEVERSGQTFARKQADMAFDHFTDKYGAEYEKALACLTKDREPLLRSSDFPAEHWRHIRTTPPR